MRELIPENTAAAPNSARTTWARLSQTNSSPGRTCSRSPNWLAIDPVGVNRPASWPSSPATRSSRARTVGSSPKTSSPTSAWAMAWRIAWVGLVSVSDSRSARQVVIG